MLSPFRSNFPVGLEFALACDVVLSLPLPVANIGSDRRADQGNQGGRGDFGEFIHIHSSKTMQIEGQVLCFLDYQVETKNSS
jgi:hypothetical protein